MTDLIKHYLAWERFTLSFTIVEDDVFAFAEDVLNDKLYADIERFATSDPAATNAVNPFKYVFESYKGVRAILSYRIANHLIYNTDILLQSQSKSDFYCDPFDEGDGNSDETKEYFYLLARKISEDAAIETGIEINPSAKIEQGLVIDHGFHTKIAVEDNSAEDNEGVVIGETCEIGKNCTILNGVTIGASDVNNGKKTGRRHPKIGSNVTVCANARILGAIDIGDNVMISPFSVVTHNIPSDCKVSIVNQLQIEKKKDSEPNLILYGLIPCKSNFLISGDNLLNCEVYLCDTDTLVDEYSVDIKQISKNAIEFAIIDKSILPQRISVCIKCGDSRLYILQPNAINIIERNEG